MNTIRNLANFTGTFLYNGSIGLITEPYKAGVRGIYKIYSIQGFEKLSKSIQASVDLISRLPQIGDSLNEISKAAVDQKEMLYGFMFFDSLGSFITVGTDKKIKFVMPPITKVLNTIGSAFDLGKFFRKYAGVQYPTFSKIADHLEAFDVNGFRPFTYRPFSALCKNPKDFFVFTVCVIEILQTLNRFIFAQGTEEEVRNARYKEISTANLLTQLGHFGKIGLIWFNANCDSTSYRILNFVTQNASLLNYMIKAK